MERPPAPGVFHFSVKEIIKLYRNIVQKALLRIHLSSRGSGLYREHVEAVKTLAWLEELWLTQYPEETNEQHLWPPQLQDLWVFCSTLVLSQHFYSVTCPLCNKVYQPEYTKVVAFQFGEDLFGHSGRGLLCPLGHSLYVIVEMQH